MRYLNGLEPAGLIGHFLAHLPEGFGPLPSGLGVPGFYAEFDLLTTADAATLATVSSLPGSRWWRRLLQWRTCFFGATVSEYLPLPGDMAADALPTALLASWNRQSRLLILKDVPLQSPLLSPEERQYAAAFLAACERLGFIVVEGQALAYVTIDFPTTDDYLARLSSGRRKDIRRKLRSRADLRIEILPTGDPRLLDATFLDTLYALYLEVYAQSELHFDKLTAAFFRAVFQDASLAGQVFLYYGADGLIGFNLCFIHDGMLIDKFVGFRYPAARRHNLYFVSWLENLEFARSRGLSHYVAGWTDPEIKSYLGAQFTLTQHAVYVRNPLLRALLKKISRRFERDRAWFDGQDKHRAPRS